MCKNSLNRKQVQALILDTTLPMTTQWAIILNSPKRMKVIQNWLKGLWIEDTDGDWCTSWVNMIPGRAFLATKVRSTSHVRVKLPASAADLKRAKWHKQEANRVSDKKYPARGDYKRGLQSEYDYHMQQWEALQEDKYEFMSGEKFLAVKDKSIFVQVLGATVLGEDHDQHQ
ncbi:MAG: hypothetical protein OEX12_15180 [Gammaproteobacteria bacterium]|nr:hypothetical protein [Gammaproteobacteria bacterium]